MNVCVCICPMYVCIYPYVSMYVCIYIELRMGMAVALFQFDSNDQKQKIEKKTTSQLYITTYIIYSQTFVLYRYLSNYRKILLSKLFSGDSIEVCMSLIYCILNTATPTACFLNYLLLYCGIFIASSFLPCR
jgi:hypothetical protein